MQHFRVSVSVDVEFTDSVGTCKKGGPTTAQHHENEGVGKKGKKEKIRKRGAGVRLYPMRILVRPTSSIMMRASDLIWISPTRWKVERQDVPSDDVGPIPTVHQDFPPYHSQSIRDPSLAGAQTFKSMHGSNYIFYIPEALGPPQISVPPIVLNWTANASHDSPPHIFR